MIGFSDILAATKVRRSTLHYVTTRGMKESLPAVDQAGQHRAYDLTTAISIALTAILADAGVKMATAVATTKLMKNVMEGLEKASRLRGPKTRESRAIEKEPYERAGTWRVSLADQRWFCVYHMVDDRPPSSVHWFELGSGKVCHTGVEPIRSLVTIEIGDVIKALEEVQVGGEPVT